MGESEKNALWYGEKACNTIMRKYEAAKLPPVDRFHYHQGVFLSGMYKIYSLTKNEDYFDYIVIDEFHHAVTEQYKRIMAYFKQIGRAHV